MAIKPKLVSIDGSEGKPQPPNWVGRYDDLEDIVRATTTWSTVVNELTESETVCFANAHMITRYVDATIMYEHALREVTKEGAIVQSKRTSSSQHNVWFTIMKDMQKELSALERDLGISPRGRATVAKKVRQNKRQTKASAYIAGLNGAAKS
jgi:P27 family predicted phage terminase small subunit